MLIVVGAHVLCGLVGVGAAVVAMLSRKGGRHHRRAGRVWLAGLTGLSLTAPVLASQDWAHFRYLVVLAGVAAAAASVGYLAARRGRAARVWHIVGMGASFVATLTAFYVDNGPRLPLWDQLPPLALWLLPSAVGFPLVLRAALRRTTAPARRCRLPVRDRRAGRASAPATGRHGATPPGVTSKCSSTAGRTARRS